MTSRTEPEAGFLRGALAAICLAAALHATPAVAEECPPVICKTFITREAFLAEAFGDTLPPVQSLDLDDVRQARIAAVFTRRYPQARVRYWRAGTRTAWIFDDIGKEGYQPTTAGFVVVGGAIEIARVLFYKESRGEQVGELSFLAQLLGARETGSGLDRAVDNISGATYSVKMMQRMARTALLFDAMVTEP